MKHTLVILAAGRGSRYGGQKQLEAVGPAGETIMDYSIYDALRSGIERVVFVISPDMEADFDRTLGGRYRSRVDVAYCVQRLEALPAGFKPPADRTKPWGTGQAVLCAEAHVDGPFVVANADDFYGPAALAAVGEFLSQLHDQGPSTYAMVGYALRDTLTEAGTVNRGVCRRTPDGMLERIVEITDIRRVGADGCHTDEDGAEQTLAGNTPVSMNLWAFSGKLMGQLRAGFERFLRDCGESMTAEFYLPTLVQDLVDSREVRVRVLPTSDRWCGITHPADRERVASHIGGLVAAGTYPNPLWG